MSCKTGGAGLDSVYNDFGCNQDKVFIMTYAPAFSNAIMLSAYADLSIRLDYPLICSEGGSDSLNAVLGFPWKDGFLLHPDGTVELLNFQRDTLTARFNELMLNSSTINPKEISRSNRLTVKTISKGIELSVHDAGIFLVNLYSMNGRLVVSKEIACSIGSNRITFANISGGSYITKISGPSGNFSDRILVTQ